jgi:hypothetical protein
MLDTEVTCFSLLPGLDVSRCVGSTLCIVVSVQSILYSLGGLHITSYPLLTRLLYYHCSLILAIWEVYGIHFAGLLDFRNILSADTDISLQTEGYSFGDPPDQCFNQCYAIEYD